MNSALERIYTILTPDTQSQSARRPYYIMRLRFEMTLAFDTKELMPVAMGFQDAIISPKKVDYRTTQITRFIPDMNVINEYRDIITRAFNENPVHGAHLTNLAFVGYDYLYAIEPKELAPGVPTKDALAALIDNAYGREAIKLIGNPNGDNVHDPVMSVGNDWLYFESGEPDIENMTPDEYMQKHDVPDIVDRMTDAVWELYEEDPKSPEVGYIFAYLYEMMEKPRCNTD